MNAQEEAGTKTITYRSAQPISALAILDALALLEVSVPHCLAIPCLTVLRAIMAAGEGRIDIDVHGQHAQHYRQHPQCHGTSPVAERHPRSAKAAADV
jgi:hypothetical protein